MTFVSYVSGLVVQNGLLKKVPFELFTHEIVSEQNTQTIANIAGEKEEDNRKQTEYANRRQILQNALAVFEEYRTNIF